MDNSIPIDKFVKNFKDLSKEIKEGMEKQLNELAFDTQKEARKKTEDEFVLRNKYATKSIIVKKATQKKLVSVAGSTAPYQEYHEEGKELSRNLWGKSEDTNPIATIYARGGNFSNKIKTKYKLNRMQKIRDMRKKDKAIAGSNLFILPVHSGDAIIYERVGSKKKDIKAVRVLSKGKKIKKRPIFTESAKKVLKSKNFKKFEFEIVNNLRK